MRARQRRLTAEDVGRHVRGRCLAPAGDREVGVEVEWLVHPTRRAAGRVSHEIVLATVAAAGPLPGAGKVTFEPGGQIELSSLPATGPAAACAGAAADLDVLRTALLERGIRLVGAGLEPELPPERVLHSPRYEAMESYFDARSNAGRTMMCSTAAVQVNVDLGTDVARVWRLAHDLGPVLAGAFANSPLAGGRPTGWRSGRLATWWSLDPTRCRPVGDGEPAECWTAYALGAQVMLVRRTPEHFVPVLSALPFGRWLSDGYDGVYPTLDDLDYHLTTLFPPVRPRGWLELRMVDALPEPWWQVPVAVAAMLLRDPGVAAAAPVITSAAGLWNEAARHGLGHPTLARAAKRCFALAVEALGASETDKGLAEVVAAYQDRYVSRGRCPADERLEAWGRDGRGLIADKLEAAAS